MQLYHVDVGTSLSVRRDQQDNNVDDNKEDNDNDNGQENALLILLLTPFNFLTSISM